MQDVLGGDWILVGTLALLGKVQTLEAVQIYRSSDGAGSDVRALSRRYGFSERASRQPHRAIAISIAKEIGLKPGAFASLGIPERWILALKCGLVINKRFVESEFSVQRWFTRIRARAKRTLRVG
jgi:hypothetical protein